MSDHNHVPYAKNEAGVPQESASAEAAMLQKLLPEYVSLYRIEANSGEYEILRLEGNTNAVELVKESWHPYEDFDEYGHALRKRSERRPADDLLQYEAWESFGSQ